jgi:hypothetical protein
MVSAQAAMGHRLTQVLLLLLLLVLLLMFCRYPRCNA